MCGITISVRADGRARTQHEEGAKHRKLLEEKQQREPPAGGASVWLVPLLNDIWPERSSPGSRELRKRAATVLNHVQELTARRRAQDRGKRGDELVGHRRPRLSQRVQLAL